MSGSKFRQTAAAMLRLMVGIPDYDTYVRHRTRYHPLEPVLTRAEFYRERTAQRFSSRIDRCC